MIAHQIKPRESTPPAPKRDPKYLAFLRELACAVCYRNSTDRDKTEAAHTGNRGRATSQKADDHDAIPLCNRDHRTGPFSYHSFEREEDWTGIHLIDLPSLRTMYLARYRAAKEAEA